jgi:hypothetical protein
VEGLTNNKGLLVFFILYHNTTKNTKKQKRDSVKKKGAVDQEMQQPLDEEERFDALVLEKEDCRSGTGWGG